MANWRVKGAMRDSGRDVEQVVTAESELAAMAVARRGGIPVSELRFEDPAEEPSPTRPQTPASEPSSLAAGVLGMLAIVFYLGALSLLAAAALTSDLETRLPLAFAALVSAAVLHGLSEICDSLKRIASKN